MRYLTLLPALVLASCQKPQPPKFDFAKQIGVAVQRSDRTCLDIRDTALSAGQGMMFVSVPPGGSEDTGQLEIAALRKEPCAEANQNKPGVGHYDVRVTGGMLPRAVPVFAIVNSSAVFVRNAAGDEVTADLDYDGQRESFRTCTSSEGVHLTVWSGKPLEGKRQWHDYYYLGYDVDADCTDADTKPDTP